MPSCPWGQRHNCTFGMQLEYEYQEPDDIIVPRQLRNTLYSDFDTAAQYRRKHRNWKRNRSTQYTKPEPSAKALMDDLVTTAYHS